MIAGEARRSQYGYDGRMNERASCPTASPATCEMPFRIRRSSTSPERQSRRPTPTNGRCSVITFDAPSRLHAESVKRGQVVSIIIDESPRSSKRGPIEAHHTPSRPSLRELVSPRRGRRGSIEASTRRLYRRSTRLSPRSSERGPIEAWINLLMVSPAQPDSLTRRAVCRATSAAAQAQPCPCSRERSVECPEPDQ